MITAALTFVLTTLFWVAYGSFQLCKQFKNRTRSIIRYDEKKDQYVVFGNPKVMMAYVEHYEKNKPGAVKYID